MSKQITLKEIAEEYENQVVVFVSSGSKNPIYTYSEKNLKTVLKYFYNSLYLPVTINNDYMWITYEKDYVSRPLLYKKH